MTIADEIDFQLSQAIASHTSAMLHAPSRQLARAPYAR
jgi:hypothetical protein